MLLLTNMQDKMHNEAIKYHRKLRDKNLFVNELDYIKGIGSKKKQLLLQEFKSVNIIKKAEIEELTKVKGITQTLAKEIKKQLNKE